MIRKFHHRLGFLLLSFFVFSGTVFSQKTAYTTTNKSAIKSYESGLKYYDSNQNEKAIVELLKAAEKDPAFIEPCFVLADLYVLKNDLSSAIFQYKKAASLNPRFFINTYLNLANIEFKSGLYEDALLDYKSFVNIKGAGAGAVRMATDRIACCEFAIQAKKNPVPFTPENLGNGINSENDEYFPSITVDDSTFIFTRNRPESQGSSRFHEDFYIAGRAGKQWGQARNAGGQLNTLGNEGVPCYSHDGKLLFFAACQRQDGQGSCDLYYSRLKQEGWTRPLNLGPPVNSGLWESQPSFSSDGRTLYFIRGRITGTGIKEQDIYYSVISDEGRWSDPMKLPGNINTDDEEEFVFIHPDNQTLYFSSDGHTGMGGLDIYISRRQQDGSWGDPENLGYPINTSGDERGLLVGPKGDIAYISSDRPGGFGGLDLYSFTLYEKARPKPTGYVHGVIADAASGKRLEATYEIIDIESGKSVMKSSSDRITGEFLASLASGKDYALNVSRNGYLFYSDHFSCKDPGGIDKPFLLDIQMEPVVVGSSVVLKNVFFDTNKFELKEESGTELKKVIAFMNSNAGIKIEISGHTDNKGAAVTNLQLSKNRAKAVYDYLVSQGISATRLTFAGYGDTRPVDSNDTETGRANNRRTEFKIISLK